MDLEFFFYVSLNIAKCTVVYYAFILVDQIATIAAIIKLR